MKNKVKKIIFIIIMFLILLIIPNMKVQAVTQEEAGQAIANFAINFYKDYGKKVKYTSQNYVLNRKKAYKDNEKSILNDQGYYLDSVGWVSYAIHQATGLDHDSVKEGQTGFVIPTGRRSDSDYENYGFERVTDSIDATTGDRLMPGDILANSYHVMIYVGQDSSGTHYFVDSRGQGPGRGLTLNSFEQYGNRYENSLKTTCGNYTQADYPLDEKYDNNRVYNEVYRITEAAANSIGNNKFVTNNVEELRELSEKTKTVEDEASDNSVWKSFDIYSFYPDGNGFFCNTTIKRDVDVDGKVKVNDPVNNLVVCSAIGRWLKTNTTYYSHEVIRKGTELYERITKNQDAAYAWAFAKGGSKDNMQAGTWASGLNSTRDGEQTVSDIKDEESGYYTNIDSMIDEQLIRDGENYKTFYDDILGAEFNYADKSKYPKEGVQATEQTVRVCVDTKKDSLMVGKYNITYDEFSGKEVDAETLNHDDEDNSNDTTKKFAYITDIKLYNQDNVELEILRLISENDGEIISDRKEYKFPHSGEQFYIEFTPTEETTSVYIDVGFKYLAECYAEYIQWKSEKTEILEYEVDDEEGYHVGVDVISIPPQELIEIFAIFSDEGKNHIQEEIQKTVEGTKNGHYAYPIWKTARLRGSGGSGDDTPPTVPTTMEFGGIVFIDVPFDKDTSLTNVNGLYDKGRDILLENVEVTLYEQDGTLAKLAQLKDKSGNITEIRTNPTLTDKNGHYEFKGVNPKKKYYITYTMGTIYTGKEDGSITDYLANGQHLESTMYTADLNKYNTDTWYKSNMATLLDVDRKKYNEKFEEIYAADGNYTEINNITGFGLKENKTYNIYNQTYKKAQQEKDDLVELQRDILAEINDYIKTNKKYPDDKHKTEIYQKVEKENSRISEVKNKIQYLVDIQVTATTGNHTAKQCYPIYDRFAINVDEKTNSTTIRILDDKYEYKPIYPGQKHINYGALEREKFDLKLSKDIQEIKVTINGKEHKYKCNKRQENEVALDVRGSDILFNSEVDRNGVEKTNTYERDLRESDIMFIDYIGEESDRRLRVFVTYKIRITNQSNGDITGYITGLSDYYDKDYTFLNSKVNGQNLAWNSEGMVDGKNKITTTGLSSLGIKASQYCDVITEYELKTEAIRDLLSDDNESTEENFAEITSYRTEYTNSRSLGTDQISRARDIAGLVDRDSRPGDFDFGKTIVISEPISRTFKNANEFVNYTYEDDFKNKGGEDRTKISLHAFQDDTDKAPGLKLRLLQQMRIITGNVFEDSIVKSFLEKENIRKGDGKLDSEDEKINKLKVELIDVDNITGSEEGTTFRTEGNKGSISDLNTEIKDNVADVYVRPKGANPGSGEFKPAIVTTGTKLVENSNTAKYNGKYEVEETRGKYAIGNYATTTVDAKGSYVISGYVPGNYLLRFIYGEKELLKAWSSDRVDDTNSGKVYNGQDYKSTLSDIYDKNEYKKAGSGSYWYHDTRENKKSDAVDNLKRRNQINNYYIDKKMNIKTVEELNYVKTHYDSNYEDDLYSNYPVYTDEQKEEMLDKLEKNTRLWADTPVMQMEVEYTETEAEYQRDKFVTYETYIVEGVDFGIVERPRQELTITKDVDNFRLIGNDGTPVFDAYDETTNLAWIKPIKDMKDRYYVDNDRNGAIEAIIDENLMHGATVKILYKLSIENTGEKDYYKNSGGEILVDEDFYIKGNKSSSAELVTNKATKIVDYVENNLKFNTNANDDDSFDVIDKIQTYNKDWERIKGENNRGKKDDNKGIYTIKDYVLSSVYEKANQYNTIIQIKEGADLGRELKPSEKRTIHKRNARTSTYGEIASTQLYLTKILDTSNDADDNFLYNNSLEVLETSNLAGRRCYNNKDKERYETEDQIIQQQIVSSVPGDYDPTEAGDPYRLQTEVATQPDYDYSERITVTVPYGSTKTATIIIVSILVAVIVLAIGIVVIKKIVLSPNKPPKIGT